MKIFPSIKIKDIFSTQIPDCMAKERFELLTFMMFCVQSITSSCQIRNFKTKVKFRICALVNISLKKTEICAKNEGEQFTHVLKGEIGRGSSENFPSSGQIANPLKTRLFLISVYFQCSLGKNLYQRKLLFF